MIYIGRLLYREFLVYFPILFNNSFQIFIARNFCCSFSSLRVMLIDSGSSSTLHLRYFTLLRILSHSIPVINFSNLVLGEQHLHVLFMGAWVAGQKKKWRCHQLLPGFLDKGHLPRASRQVTSID